MCTQNTPNWSLKAPLGNLVTQSTPWAILSNLVTQSTPPRETGHSKHPRRIFGVRMGWTQQCLLPGRARTAVAVRCLSGSHDCTAVHRALDAPQPMSTNPTQATHGGTPTIPRIAVFSHVFRQFRCSCNPQDQQQEQN